MRTAICGLTGAFMVWAAAFAACAQSSDPASIARRAAGQLEAAQNALQAAQRASDRISALTQTIRAYENGLVALRESLRRAAIRETALRRAFDAKRDRVSRLLGVLQAISSSPAPLLLLHPLGPVGTARSGMIVADITPGLQRQADTLKHDLEEIALMRAVRAGAAATLEDGLAGVQQARTALALAISSRTDLPHRYLTDPQALSRLINSSETLKGFAAGLADQARAGDPAPDTDFSVARGSLPLPVNGTVLRRAGEADAAGIVRPGVIIATAPRALVTTPLPATVRYAGPLLDYGIVMILEPDDSHLLVLAGLEQVYGEPGDVLPAGAAVGLMGGAAPDTEAFMALSADRNGMELSETLYMELRQGEEPVDPAEWFAIE